MKIFHKDNYKNHLICLVSLIIAVCALPLLPKQIPIHFDVHGVPDGYGSSLTILAFPAIILFINIMAEITKYTDPKASNYSFFSKHYYFLFAIIDIFMVIVQSYMIIYGLDKPTLNISHIMTNTVGVLFIFVGNYMPKIKQNFFMGIKTPWTLADETVWYKTHRLSGKLWFTAGIVMCICGLLLPGKYTFVILMILSGLMVVFPLIYSYIIFKRRSQ